MGVLGLWHCTLLVRGDPWTDAEKTGADVMDCHDSVCIFIVAMTLFVYL